MVTNTLTILGCILLISILILTWRLTRPCKHPKQKYYEIKNVRWITDVKRELLFKCKKCNKYYVEDLVVIQCSHTIPVFILYARTQSDKDFFKEKYNRSVGGYKPIYIKH